MNKREAPGAEVAGGDKEASGAEKGKNIFSRLCERLKSSEVVQNVVDRVKIWTSSAFSKWYEGDVAERQFRINRVREEQQALRKNAEENTKALQKLMELGPGISDEKTVSKVRAEIASLEAKAVTKEVGIEKGTETIRQAEEKIAAFKERAEAAKDRIADRIANKIAAHEKNLEMTLAVKRRAETIVQQQRAEIDACEKKMAEAEVLSGGTKNKELLALKKEVIEGLKKRRERHLAVIARQEGILKKSGESKDSLEEKIRSLSEKRSGVLGERGKVKEVAAETQNVESRVIKGSFGESGREPEPTERRFSRESAVRALKDRLSNPQTIEDLRLINSAQIVAMGLKPDFEYGEDVSKLLVDNFGGRDYESSFNSMADSIRKYREAARVGGTLTKESEEAINLAFTDLRELVDVITGRRIQQAA